MIYEAQCSGCDIHAEYTRPMDQCLDTPVCIECGEKMVKVISTPPNGFVKGNFQPFRSMVDGSIITTDRDLTEHNRRNDVVNLSEGYSEEKIKSGNFGARPKTSDIVELKKDMTEAVQQLNDGYKPQIGVLEDE